MSEVIGTFVPVLVDHCQVAIHCRVKIPTRSSRDVRVIIAVQPEVVVHFPWGILLGEFLREGDVGTSWAIVRFVVSITGLSFDRAEFCRRGRLS